MRNVTFHGCSDYVEHFWNMIPDEKQPDVIYQRVLTKEDVIDWADLKVGMTLHMMASRLSPKRDQYIVSEAVTEDLGHLEIEANLQVVALRAAGALLVDDGYGRHTIVVRTYEELVEAWGVKELVEDPRWSPITLLSQRYYHSQSVMKLHQYFIENSRVFTAEELEVIAGFKKAEAAYYGLFYKPESEAKEAK